MRLLVVAHLLGLVLLIIHSQADTNDERRKMYMEVIFNCTMEIGITFEEYAISFANNTITEKTKCVNACVFKAHDIMLPNGTINAEKAIEHLSSNRVGIDINVLRDTITECSNNKGENDCDTAQKLMDCVIVDTLK